MSEKVSADHPIQELLFFSVGPTELDKEKIAGFVEQLAASRNWVIRPPYAADFSEEDESDPDSRSEAVGGGA